MNNTHSVAGDNPVNEMIESFVARWRRGERPDLEAYVQRCPERAEEIRSRLAAAVAEDQTTKNLSTDLLDRTINDPTTASVMLPPHPKRLGDYQILDVIGEGGMGLVYLAEHDSLKNRVALKVMHARFRADRDYLKRFRTEARAAARIHHTNIVSVFDYGEQDGICYYAMQFIDGFAMDKVIVELRRLRSANDRPRPGATAASGNDRTTEQLDTPLAAVSRGLATGRPPSTQHVDDQNEVPTQPLADVSTGALGFWISDQPSTSSPSGEPIIDSQLVSRRSETIFFQEVARLGAQIADALDYAHRKQIVHRDIKPSNLILDLQGNIWVTDFGLAKLLDSAELTQSRDMVGTLRYMAPERFRGITDDPRSDIYSLSATLYELLTLKPVFTERDPLALIHEIAHQAPIPPRHLDPRIPRDLEIIVLKTLAKHPKDRCRNAGELRDQLRRFLDGRPTSWRRVGPLEHMRRWCGRNPIMAILSFLLAVVMVVSSVGAAITIPRLLTALEAAQREANFRQISERATLRQLFETLISQAQASRLGGRAGQRFSTLESVAKAEAILARLALPPDDHARHRLRLRNLAIAALALPDLRLAGDNPAQYGRACDYDDRLERRAVFDADTGSIRVELVESDALLFRLEASRGNTYPRLSRDGRTLQAWNDDTRELRVWDLSGKQPRLLLEEPPGTVLYHPVFSHDGERLAYRKADEVWDVVELRTGKRRRLPSAVTPVYSLAFHPDGRRVALVTSGPDGRFGVRVQEPPGMDVLAEYLLPPGVIAENPPVWSPDGRRLALAASDLHIYVWTLGRGTPVVLQGHINLGVFIAFSHRGDLLASNSWSQELSLWDPRTGERLVTIGGAGEWHHPPRFDLDDERLASGGQIFDVASRREFRSLRGTSGLVAASGHVRPGDGRLLVCAGRDQIYLIDLWTGDSLAQIPLGEAFPEFDRQGDLWTYGVTGLVRWPIRTGPDDPHAYEVGPPETVWPAGRPDVEMAISPDGRSIALANRFEGTLLLHLGPPRRMLRLAQPGDIRHALGFSPDGRYLATGGFRDGGERGLCVWETATGRLVHARESGHETKLGFDPSGHRLWFEGRDVPPSTIAVGTWDDLQPSPFQGWSPDGRLAVGWEPKARSVRDEATGRELFRLENPGDERVPYRFTPDGDYLVGCSLDSTKLCIWDLRLLRRRLREMNLDWSETPLENASPTDPAIPPTPLTVRLLGAERMAEIATVHEEAHRRMNEGQIAAALMAWERLLELVPDHAEALNSLAWALATGPPAQRDPERALTLALRAADLAPSELVLNTLGVAQYRAGRFADAVATLERNAQVQQGGLQAFDLFFLAMARARLGAIDQARDDFDRAIRSLQEHPGMSQAHARELNSFEQEARLLLDPSAGELPANVFAPEPPSQP